MDIMGKTTRKIEHIDAFLKSKGCPEYARLYSIAGERWGVRWDMAVFQSCLETGYWKFGGDVKVQQNNFAGIGARGGGVPGDSFATPALGIEAQVQNLALRAGKFIPAADIISPYVQKNYELISKRNTKTWEELSGTYAADVNYHQKVFAIMREFDMFALSLEKDVEKASWINITKENGLAVQAMVGDKAIDVCEGNSVEKLVTFLEEHMETAKTYGVGGRFVLAEPVQPDEPKKWEKSEWLPFAIKRDKMQRRATQWPKYLIIHWTAGRPMGSGIDGIDYGASKGHTYLFLQYNGDLYQGAPTNAGGYHVGDANVSSFECLGVEVACAGRLEKVGDKFKPWYATSEKEYFSRNMVIYDEDGPEDDESFKGWYQLYSPEQVKMLTKLSLYAVQVLGIKLENIRGHDMVATPSGRKVDPGFSIGEGGLTAFRKKIASLLEQGKTWEDF
jgi:hypothetical protein